MPVSKTFRIETIKLFVLLTMVLTVPAFAGLSVAARQRSTASTTVRSQPRTVLDYYRLLSAAHLNVPEGVKTRKPVVAKTDIANGYLLLEPPPYSEGDGGWESWANAEVVLFKKRAGGYVVGVAQTETVTVSTTILKFLEYDAGKWRDVTNAVMPEITERMIRAALLRAAPAEAKELRDDDMMLVTYSLPRVGRSIIAQWDYNAKLFKLNWNGERFELVEKNE